MPKSIYLIIAILCVINTCCEEEDSASPELSIPELAITNNFTTKIEIAIRKETEASSRYEVRYSTKSNMTEAVSKEFISTGLALTELNPGTTYYLQIRAFNGAAWSTWSETKISKTADFKTTVETYNIFSQKYDEQFPNFIWSDRKEAVRNIIKQSDNDPDIIGIQEAIITTQMNEFESLMGASYESYISSRGISPRAIFWKADLYTLISSDDIEIIPVPRIYSSQRYATYVRLKHKATNKEIDVFNIHLPSGPSRQEIRNIAANTLSQKILAIYEEDKKPVIILGDYNNYLNTVINGISSSPSVFSYNGFTDTYQESANKINAAYMTTIDKVNEIARTGSVNGEKRVDYIFTYPKERITVSDYSIVINFAASSNIELKKPVPSDHHPVRSTLHMFY